MKNITFTPEGLDAAKQEYTILSQSRPAAVVDLRKAREMGDLSENGYYKSARGKLSDIDRNLRRLQFLIKNARVVSAPTPGIVSIGSTVTVTDQKKKYTYTLVGDYEADPKSYKISSRSPIGKALLGKKLGDNVTVEVPAGKQQLTIIAISI